MSFFEGFFKGIGSYGMAMNILMSRKFWWFIFFPILLLIAIFMGGSWFASWATDVVVGEFTEGTSSWVKEWEWLSYLVESGNFLIRLLMRILYYFVFVSFGGYVVLIFLSPVFSILSERAENHLTGRIYPFDVKQFINDIFRGIWIALRNMVIQTFILLILFLFTFVPIIGLVSPILIFFVNSYFYGFAFVDYAVERKKYNVRESVHYVNKNMGIVVGVGSVFAFCLLIPWFSLIVCSFISLLSVLAGTVAINDLDKIEMNKQNKK